MLRLVAVVLAALPSFALPVGREVPVAAPAIEPAPFLRWAPRVASDGNDFLVVWQDDVVAQTIRAARVTSDGVVIDRPALFAGAGFTPAVASDGHGYVVTSTCSSRAVCFAHVDAATGAVTATAEIGDALQPAIASDGSGYLAVYRTLSSGRLMAVALASDGTLAGTPFYVAQTQYAPAIASNGESYFVVWSTYSYLRGVRASEEGVTAAVQQFMPQAAPFGPSAFAWSVASDGSSFAVAWQHNLGVANQTYVTELRAANVSPEGIAGDARRVAGDNAWEPALTWTGAGYLLTYRDGTSPGDIRGTMLGDGAQFAVAQREGREANSASASNGVATLVAWEHQWRSDAGEIEARLFVRGAAEPRPIVVVSTALTWQDAVAAARVGTYDVVAWDENAGETQVDHVLVQRFRDDGTPLDGSGIAVAASERHQRRPALAGRRIVWVEEALDVADRDASIWTQRLDITGAPYGRASRIGTARRDSGLAIAAIDETYLVAWESPDARITGAIVGMEGELSPLVLPESPLDESSPAVATDGANFLLAWNRLWLPDICAGICQPLPSVESTIVTRYGVPLGASEEIAPIYAAAPRAVWNGREYVVFWSSDGSVAARRISRSGNAIGAAQEIPIRATLEGVTWDGATYLAVAGGAFVQLDGEFRVLDRIPLPGARAGSAAIAGRSIVYLSSGRRGIDSRAVLRRFGDDVERTRRRSVR